MGSVYKFEVLVKFGSFFTAPAELNGRPALCRWSKYKAEVSLDSLATDVSKIAYCIEQVRRNSSEIIGKPLGNQL